MPAISQQTYLRTLPNKRCIDFKTDYLREESEWFVRLRTPSSYPNGPNQYDIVDHMEKNKGFPRVDPSVYVADTQPGKEWDVVRVFPTWILGYFYLRYRTERTVGTERDFKHLESALQGNIVSLQQEGPSC